MAYPTFLDYSASKISGALIKRAGHVGVIRYIDSPSDLGTKHTSLAEYRDHAASALQVYLVFQIGTGDADRGSTLAWRTRDEPRPGLTTSATPARSSSRTTGTR